MQAFNRRLIALCAVALPLVGGNTHAAAQCRVADFEDQSVGTIVTSQIPGVTFSTVGGPSGTSDPEIIAAPTGGTSSGSQALAVTFAPGQEFCHQFGSQFMRVVFDELQPVVALNLGGQLGTPSQQMVVRAYDDGGSLISSQNVTTGPGVRTGVTVGAPGGAASIRRIEIDGNNVCPAIDDLRFGDDEPPLVELAQLPGCVCGDEGVTIRGQTCASPGGTFALERHEFRPAGADPGDPWTTIAEFSSPLCGDPKAALTIWDTSSVPQGNYDYRITVENDCGISATDYRRTHVRHSFGTVSMSSPGSGEAVCGEVDLAGTILGCGGACGGVSYTVEFRAAGSGDAFQPVDPSTPEYAGRVLDCTFATWDTEALELSDGEYEIQIVAENGCGHTETLTRTLNVDSTECPCAGDVNETGEVNVDDLLEVLNNWGACP